VKEKTESFATSRDFVLASLPQGMQNAEKPLLSVKEIQTIQEQYRDTLLFPAVQELLQDIQNAAGVRLAKNTFLVARRQKNTYKPSDIVILSALANFARYKQTQEDFSFSLREFLQEFSLTPRWTRYYAQKVLSVFRTWYNTDILSFSERGYEMWHLFDALRVQNVYTEKGLADVQVQIRFSPEFLRSFADLRHMLPLWLVSLPEKLIPVGFFFFLDVFPYGTAFAGKEQLQRFFGTINPEKIRLYVAAWNTATVGRKWQPFGQEKEIHTPPLLFERRGVNGPVYFFFVADNKWLMDTGKNVSAVPTVFSLPVWREKQQRKHAVQYSKAFSLLLALSSVSAEAAKIFLLLVYAYMLEQGPTRANAFLSALAEAKPQEHRGHIYFAHKVLQLPIRDFDMIHDFVRGNIEILKKKEVTYKFLAELADALAQYIAEKYISPEEEQAYKQKWLSLTEEERDKYIAELLGIPAVRVFDSVKKAVEKQAFLRFVRRQKKGKNKG